MTNKPLLAGMELTNPTVLARGLYHAAGKAMYYWYQYGATECQPALLSIAERWARVTDQTYRRLAAALERQEPVVVTEKHRLGHSWFSCPVCDYCAIDKQASYCGACGTRLEWRVEE